MPPSQLKRLKASLREQGITGPQQSKKQKRREQANGAHADKRIKYNAALDNIREQFNPFEVKAPAREQKFHVVSNRGSQSKVGKGVTGRPGVTKSFGEEARKKTLLREIQHRNKVGGIVDRRFGENDPTMTPEEKMLERFTKEKQRSHNKGSLFDLEDDQEEETLTHFGKSLAFDGKDVDDFDDGDLSLSDEDAVNGPMTTRKRHLPEDLELPIDAADDNTDREQPERKKSKAEVMKEVIAKSKLHKYERQQAKEDDDILREELDKGLPDLLALFRGRPNGGTATLDRPTEQGQMDPGRAAMLNLDHRADKKYDETLRQMAFDKRAQPSERTKTEEEKAAAEAQRLRELEEARQRRMHGEEDQSAEEGPDGEEVLDGEVMEDDAATFGLGPGVQDTRSKQELDVEDEDEFIIDEDLVALASEIDISNSESESSQSQDESQDSENGDDDEFLDGLLTKEELDRPEFGKVTASNSVSRPEGSADKGLAYTYPCPQNHNEFLEICENASVTDLPVVVQRIRTLYHPRLNSDNKAKLGIFATILIEHIAYLADSSDHPPFIVLEAIIRHIHSLAKSYPEEVGRAFRSYLRIFQDKRPLNPTASDLIILTAIGSIFSTSDHFHQVVTPAMLSMARYLGQGVPQDIPDLVKGTYVSTLFLQYQRLSKRYVPELVHQALSTLCLLAPENLILSTSFHQRDPKNSLRLVSCKNETLRLMRFWDIRDVPEDQRTALGLAILETQTELVVHLSTLWAGKSAFYEVFRPLVEVFEQLLKPSCRAQLPESTSIKIQKAHLSLSRAVVQARLSRSPLTLHYHRPLAIKTSLPKFEESYNPDKHYDPQRERAELNKLKAEHKKERKGAMRELRKDANFIARESLREKKERDREYEQKYRRLVAEIQGEEGREANAYEREKKLRKSKK